MNLESAILQNIRIAASKIPGVVLFRNNSGKLQDQYGRWVSFGVGSPGGADLIGWKIISPIRGSKYAIFIAIEVKVPGGHRRPEQIQFIDSVRKAGGIAGFAESVGDAIRILDASNRNA